MAPAALGAFLNNIPTPWAVGLAGLIGALTYDAATFCLSDPPAIPTFTAADTEAMLHPEDVVNFAIALGKFKNLVGHYLWFQVCECTSGTMIAPGTPPAEPSGNPVLNPPRVSPPYPTGQACATYSFHDEWSSGSNIFVQTPNTPIPSGLVSATATISINVTSVGGSENDYCQVNWLNSSGTNLGSPVSAGISSAGSTLTATGAPPSGTTQYFIRREIRNPAGFRAMDSTVSFSCSSDPGGGPVQGPCPPDDFTLGLLDQILKLVTLIQRQAVPFAYIDGTPSTGLTGAGHISVQGLIGCRVTLTSTSNIGIEAGDPNVVFNAGWINFGDSHGYSDRRFINASPIQFFPRAAGQYTRIGYSLEPGNVATIVPLVREP